MLLKVVTLHLLHSQHLLNKQLLNQIYLMATQQPEEEIFRAVLLSCLQNHVCRQIPVRMKHALSQTHKLSEIRFMRRDFCIPGLGKICKLHTDCTQLYA